MPAYQPPFNITPDILRLVADSEQIGLWSGLLGRVDEPLSPQLRRGNRIKTIQASLVEYNRLTLEQVTAVLDGKRVLGLPREIQEVRNAFAAYEQLPHWQSFNLKHLLTAHQQLMLGLVDDAGRLHQSGVGIYRDEQRLILESIQGEMTLLELMQLLKQVDRSKFRTQIIKPLLEAGLIEATLPDKPTSSKQKYRLVMR